VVIRRDMVTNLLDFFFFKFLSTTLQKVTYDIQLRNKIRTIFYTENNNTVMNINYIQEISGKILEFILI
jgi:DNA polymerase II large subunit